MLAGPSGPADATPCTGGTQMSRCCCFHQSVDPSKTNMTILGSSFLQRLFSSGFAQSPEGRHLQFPFILLHPHRRADCGLTRAGW